MTIYLGGLVGYLCGRIVNIFLSKEKITPTLLFCVLLGALLWPVVALFYLFK